MRRKELHWRRKKLRLKYVEYEDLSADHITPILLMTNDETMLATDLFRTTTSQSPTGTIIFHSEKILFKINWLHAIHFEFAWRLPQSDKTSLSTIVLSRTTIVLMIIFQLLETDPFYRQLKISYSRWLQCLTSTHLLFFYQFYSRLPNWTIMEGLYALSFGLNSFTVIMVTHMT